MLKQQVQQYKEALDFILNVSSEQLQLTPYQELDINSKFQFSSIPFTFQNPSQDNLTELAHWHFVTVTFDPSKFGVSNLNDDERKYILYQIVRCIRRGFIKQVYGSFELHQNGRTHAHFICYALDNDYKELLKKSFTDNPYNKRAVVIYPAKFPKVLNYINKESTNYFKTNDHEDDINPLDELR